MQRSTLIRLLLMASVMAVFGSICTHEFTNWDDSQTISNNPRLNPPTVGNVLWYWTHAEMEIYMPLTRTVWGAMAWLGELQRPDELGIALNPEVFHAASVLAHMLTVLAVYALLRRLVEREWAAFAGALLYGLHPVQVEPVAWTSGLKDVLCGLFAITALWQYVEYVRARSSPADTETRALPRTGRAVPGAAGKHRAASQRATRGTRSSGLPPPTASQSTAASHSPSPLTPRAHYALALIAFICAMLSKPTGMIVPALAAVIDWIVLRRPLRTVARTLGPWMLLSAACAVVAKIVQPGHGVPVTPFWTRPFIGADSLVFYLFKLVFPAALNVDYGRRPDVVMSSPWVYVVWLIPAALAAFLWRVRKGAPVLPAAGLLFVVGLSPVLGFTPFLFQYYSTTADHYLYQAILGPALALAWLLSRRSSRAVAALCAIALSALGVRSFVQAGHWQNSVTLWRHAVELNPRSFAGYTSLGNAIALNSLVEKPPQSLRMLEESADYSRKAIQIEPDYHPAYESLTMYYMRRGRTDDAIETYKKYLQIMVTKPTLDRHDVAEGYSRLGQLLMQRGRSREAVEQYEEALRLDPGSPTREEMLQRARAEAREGTTTTQAPDPGARR